MADIKEKIFNYLEKAGEAKTIGEILSAQEFRGVKRQELSKVLKELQAEEKAFRKVIDGKAYYSVDSDYGEGRNPSQQFIMGFNDRLNGRLNAPGANGLEGLLSALGAGDHSSGKKEDENKYKDLDVSEQQQDLAQRVIVDNAFIVWLPSDMKYSTDVFEIHQNRVLSAITTDDFEDNEFSLAEPFNARRNISITHPTDKEIDLSNKLIVQLMTMASQAVLGKNVQTVKDDEELIVKYSVPDENTAVVLIIASKGVYMVQYFMNDVPDEKNRQKLAKAFAEKIEICPEVEKEYTEPEVLVPFTYNENRWEKAAYFALPVPDSMQTMNEYTDEHPEDSLFRTSLDEFLRSLMIPKNSPVGFVKYTESPVTIYLASAVSSNPKLAVVWIESDSISVDVESTLTNILNAHAERNGIKKPSSKIIKADKKEKLAIAYVKENTIPARKWTSYLYAILYNDSLFQGKLLFITTSPEKVMEKIVVDYLSQIKLLPPKELELARIEMKKESLGEYAAEDGHIDAVKVSQLFSKDVVFNNDDEITSSGKHHTMNKFQFNAAEIDNYQDIKSNFQTFNDEILWAVHETEKNENLCIGSEYFHKDLLKATGKRSLSGTVLFYLCAHHMITINEEDDTYAVALDQNIIKGIPEAYKYIAEFIQTLRAVNGKSGPFTVTMASTFNLDSPISGAINGTVEGAAEHESTKTIKVQDGEHPYAGIIRSLQMKKKRRMEEERQARDYDKAVGLSKKSDPESLRAAVKIFSSLGSYKDAAQLGVKAAEEADELERKELQRKKESYEEALQLAMNEDSYSDLSKACDILKALGDYEDAKAVLGRVNRIAGNLKVYSQAIKLADSNTINNLQSAVSKLNTLHDYKDSKQLIEEYTERIHLLENEELYNNALSIAAKDTIEDLHTAIEEFSALAGFRDAEERIEKAQNRIKELEDIAEQERLRKEAEELRAKKRKTRNRILVIAAILAVIGGLCFYKYGVPALKYNGANKALQEGRYEDALNAFTELGEYKDSASRINDAKYAQAGSLAENQQFDEAIEIYTALHEIDYLDSYNKINETKLQKAQYAFDQGDYKTASDELDVLKTHGQEYKDLWVEATYNYAVELKNDNNYEETIKAFKDILTYKDSAELYSETCYTYAQILHDKEDYKGAVEYLSRMTAKDTKDPLYLDSYYQYGLSLMKSSQYSKAIEAFNKVSGYSDASSQINEAKYRYVSAHRNSTDKTTYSYLNSLRAVGYKDSAAIFNSLYKWSISKIVANTSKTDTKSDNTSISKNKSVYFHWKIQGGEPGKSVKVAVYESYSNGITDYTNYSGNWRNGDDCWYMAGWDRPAYAPSTTLTITVYLDGVNVGSKTISRP